MCRTSSHVVAGRFRGSILSRAILSTPDLQVRRLVHGISGLLFFLSFSGRPGLPTSRQSERRRVVDRALITTSKRRATCDMCVASLAAREMAAKKRTRRSAIARSDLYLYVAVAIDHVSDYEAINPPYNEDDVSSYGNGTFTQMPPRSRMCPFVRMPRVRQMSQNGARPRKETRSYGGMSTTASVCLSSEQRFKREARAWIANAPFP